MSGCNRHHARADRQCADCALDAELRALPMIDPPPDLAAGVVAAIAGEDAALEARLRSLPQVEPPADLGARVDDAVADADAYDALEQALRTTPMLEPPAGWRDAIDVAIDDAMAFDPIAAVLRTTPALEPPIDLAAAVLDELAYEDQLRRGAVWRAGGIGLSAAAAGMLLLTDPAGIGSATASLFDRATAYVPTPEQLGPVAHLGDFRAPAEPGLADHVVSAFDSAQLALANGITPASATEWLGVGQLWWMVLGVVALVALNGALAKVMFRRA